MEIMHLVARLPYSKPIVLLTGFLKLLGPLYLVIPGVVAAILYMEGRLDIPVNPETGLAVSDKAYGLLVNMVLPAPLKGFFAAVLLGAILSSFNSMLNSVCTLFSLDVYKRWINPEADDNKVVKTGKYFGWIVTIASIIIAPLLMKAGSIFEYLQSMNGLAYIPMLAIVVIAMTTKKVPAIAANTTLICGNVLIAIGYYVPPFKSWVLKIGQFHYTGIVFAIMIVTMLIWGRIAPMPVPYEEKDAKVTDLKSWRFLPHVAMALLALIAFIYISFADFSVFSKGKPSYPTVKQATTETVQQK